MAFWKEKRDTYKMNPVKNGRFRSTMMGVGEAVGVSDIIE
jgi:hypothetical protein